MTRRDGSYCLSWRDIDKSDLNVTLRGSRDLALVWLGVLLIATLSGRLFSYSLYGVLGGVAAIVAIGVLQNGLASLSHHAVHRNLHPRAMINDYMFRWLLSAPMGQSYLTLRREHLRHHAHFAEDDDPERFYYDLDTGDRKSPMRLILWTLSMFTGFVALGQIRRLLSNNRGGADVAIPIEQAKRERKEYLYVIPAQIALFAIFYAATGSLFGYFVYWAFPLVTVGAGLNALRATIEHADPEDPATHYRTFLSNPIERFIVGPFNFNYHYEHHRFMNVPYYRAEKLRAMLTRSDDYSDCKIEKSYLSRYRSILRMLNDVG